MAAQRIVVTGATGNLGIGLLRVLSADPRVGAVTALARRRPRWALPKIDFVEADVSAWGLTRVFRDADVVVHLAWLFQPTRRPEVTWNANVLGSIRVFEAAAEAGVSKIVYSSSVGAYSPREDDRPVDENWPTHGWPNAAYTREKAYLERYLDGFEPAHPRTRVARVRPGFVFRQEAASEQRRLFAGPFLPGSLARPGVIPMLPDVPGLRMQVVHSDDVADALHRCVRRHVSGAFNLAADPVVDTRFLADLFGAKLVPVPAFLARYALATAWRLRLIPATAGLFDAVLHLPVMSTVRAKSELDWQPRRTAAEALNDFFIGLRGGAGGATPPLAPDDSRLHEISTGVGKRP
ncbi:NAD-dependent epimerase [Prauserella marina]|uniref:Nucleoside-diphosphate-sugar epimerase n=1 Tax=Prauserella marina TaxID=530584 RepID=A0A222VSD0_9PSEU|nr:NAD-dependent epimerase/dehydratase family protein [Prauserella marina]ASR36621.1 NAD-dependent epimerase [Prauserella marina]PWV74034.1 nucleoside-diphosphate-sugar epimerase [Prauserella marina]SDD61375.1 Nucleoside-diphosphate-sugar epimerase [Prauserella marina]